MESAACPKEHYVTEILGDSDHSAMVARTTLKYDRVDLPPFAAKSWGSEAGEI